MIDDAVWTVVVPIKGEATYTVRLPAGSTKYDACRAVMAQEKGVKETEVEWGFADDPQSGEYACAWGPGCDGEDVDEDSEGDEDDEDES